MKNKKIFSRFTVNKRTLLLGTILLFVNSMLGQVTIEMKETGKVFTIPGKVNGLNLNFIFDTGASDVYLSLAEAVFMVKNGYLSEKDITGTSYSQIANGDVVENTNVLLKEIEIGGIKIYNVTASISHNMNAPLLLGQSAIQKLGPIQLEGNKLIIKNGKNFKSDKEAEECLNKGFQEIEAENYERAITILNEGLDLANDSKIRSLIYGELASAYYHLGKYEMALKCGHDGLGEDPMNELLGYNLGYFLYEMNKKDQSEKAFKQQIVKFGNNPNADKEILAATYAYLGDIQFEKGEYINAETNFKNSINIAEGSQAYLGLGDLYSAQENYKLAIYNYEKGIAYEPNRPSNIKRFYQLGLACVFGEEIEKARLAFSNSKRVYRDNIKLVEIAMGADDLETKIRYSEFMYNAASSDLWLGRLAESPQECIAHYNNAMSIQPLKSDIIPRDYINIADAHRTLKNIDDAKSIIIEARKHFPDDLDLMFFMSLLYDDGDAEILALLTKILEYEYKVEGIIFDYATIYNNIAWYYCCNKQYAEALPYAEKSIVRNKTYAFSWDTLGQIYFYLGKYEKCVEAMTNCLSCEGELNLKKSALKFRGQSLIKMGKKKSGKADMDAAENM